jgi:nucleoside-triphosphatase
MRLAKLLEGRKMAGFYTQEIRRAGQRSGFSVRTFGGVEGLLSSAHLAHGPRVGRYRVDVGGFEEIVLVELTKQSGEVDVFLIDEIGKMECFSRAFVQAVKGILDGNVAVVATVALKGKSFMAEVKTRPDIEIIEVTPANRDSLPRKLADDLV